MDEGKRNPWPYPPELDAMKAAPDYHDLLLENDHTRVLVAHCGVGNTVPVHTHCWPGLLYTISWSDFVRRDGDGNVLVDTRGHMNEPPGSAFWEEALPPHSLENVGATELRTLVVEFKDLS
jgi:hypothetical protein